MKHINNRIRRAMALMAVMVVATATAMAQVKYIDADGTEKTCSSYNTVGNGSNVTWNGSSNGGWYFVSGTNVTINSSATVSGAVKLILADGAKLTVNGAADKAGIVVTGSNSLTIYGQTDGTGILNATGGSKGAGIGGGKGQTSGTITINGGTITANGAGGGAGIGGGIGGSIGNFTMNRGTVTANGSLLATGVGAGAKPTPKFSVSATKTVEFSKGNLYWNGNTWKFEANQWDYRTWAGKNSCINGTVTTNGTPTNHCGLFKWGNATEAIAGNSDAPTGNFFAASNFTVDGKDGWKALTREEWAYLLTTRTVTVNNKEKASYGEGVVNGVNGLIILCDDWDGSVCAGFTYGKSAWSNTFSETTTPKWSEMESAGVVFLPAAGGRNGTTLTSVGSSGFYWSSSLHASVSTNAYGMNFDSVSVTPQSINMRRNGFPVRLVR